MTDTKRNGFIPIAVAVVIALVVVGVGFALVWKKAPQIVQNLTVTAPVPTATSTVDTTGWKTIKNKYGWTIKYPPNWSVDVACNYANPSDCNPEERDGPSIQGPDNCYENKKNCGTVQIETALGAIPEIKNSTPRDFLLKYNFNPAEMTLLDQRSSTIDGQPSYEITYLYKNEYPHGQIHKEIAVKYNGVLYTINYFEENYVRLAPVPVQEWTLTNTFNQILSTFKFIPDAAVGTMAATTNSDSRILLTPDLLKSLYATSNLNSLCNAKVNDDLPSATVVYHSSEKGLSLEIPYNPKWGTDIYRINPYDEDGKLYDDGANGKVVGKVFFGPLEHFEGCSLLRGRSMEFLIYKSADQILADIKKRDDYDTLVQFGVPSKVSISGFDVVKYQDYGLCSYPTLIVIGEKYNYKFTSLCNGSFEDLEKKIKTMKLIQ